MNEDKRLRHEHKRADEKHRDELQELHNERHQHSGALEFSTVEDMLRYDAAQTIMPEHLAVRLNHSVVQAPKPEKLWWQRLFRRG